MFAIKYISKYPAAARIVLLLVLSFAFYQKTYSKLDLTKLPYTLMPREDIKIQSLEKKNTNINKEGIYTLNANDNSAT